MFLPIIIILFRDREDDFNEFWKLTIENINNNPEKYILFVSDDQVNIEKDQKDNLIHINKQKSKNIKLN